MLKIACVVFALLFSAAVGAHPNWQFMRAELPNNEPALLDWRESIARIEVLSGPTTGTNGVRPTVTFRILELLRGGNTAPSNTSAIFKASWLSDPEGGPNWQTHKKNGTLDAWRATPVVSPPAGTRALVFTEFSGEMRFLNVKRFFPDTEANRLLVIASATREPLLSRLSHAMLLAIMVFPIIALGLVARYPLLAIILASTIWPIYWTYEAQIPASAMFRVDLIPVLGGMVGSGLVVLAAVLLAIWRDKKTRRMPPDGDARQQRYSDST